MELFFILLLLPQLLALDQQKELAWTQQSTLLNDLSIKLFVGTPLQEVSLRLDTMKDWTAIKATECSSCISPQYNKAGSSSYVKVAAQAGTNVYDDIIFVGLGSTETLSVDSTGATAVTGMSFYVITDVISTSKDTMFTSGYIGLGRVVQSSEKTITTINGDRLTKSLAAGSKLSADIFAISLDLSGTSTIDLGAVKATSVNLGDLSGISYMDITVDSLFWKTGRVSAVRIGTDSKTSYGFTASYHYDFDFSDPVIFSTSHNMIHAPVGQGKEILMRLIDEKTSSFNGSVYEVDCFQKEQYPDLFFKVKGLWLQVRADDYFVQHDSKCFIGIVLEEDESRWIFGARALADYYVVFDNSNEAAPRMGFALTSSSTKAALTSAGDPIVSIDSVMWEHTWVFWLYQRTKNGLIDFYPLFKLAGDPWVWVFGLPDK